MTDPVSFNARALFTFAPDRTYRVEVNNGALYFLRIGGQFDLDRGAGGAVTPEHVPAIMILAAGEALFRSHKKEELIARDPTQDAEELLAIHPHNFKLTHDDVTRATLLPRKWLLSFVRPHFGRLVIEPADGKRQEFHFERLQDVKTAFAYLPEVLGDRLETRIHWDDTRKDFVKNG